MIGKTHPRGNGWERKNVIPYTYEEENTHNPSKARNQKNVLRNLYRRTQTLLFIEEEGQRLCDGNTAEQQIENDKIKMGGKNFMLMRNC